MKKIFAFVNLSLLIICTNFVYSQSPTVQDCPCAIPICQNIYTEVNAYSGQGNLFPEINKTISCLGQGEKNDVWYTFTVQSSGSLAFSITPNVLADDYDWAVYNLTNNSCADIFSNPSIEVACNFAGTPGITGPNGLPGPQNELPIPVLAGQTYVINVSQFSVSPNGYTINFTASTASIIDITAPGVQSVDSNFVCGQNFFQITFTENIQCSSVDAADFTLTDPNGTPLTIDSVTSPNCNSVCGYSRVFTFWFNPGANFTGTYNLTLVNTIADICGNAATFPTNFPITVSAYTYNNTITATTCPAGSDGSVAVNVVSPVGNYTYLWSNGSTLSAINGLSPGTYTVTVSQQGSCSDIQTFIVNGPQPWAITSNTTSTPCNGSLGAASVSVDSGGTAPFTFVWNNGTTGQNINNLTGGVYTVTITDANNCTVTQTITIPQDNNITADFTHKDSLLCAGIEVRFTNISVGGLTYSWNFGDGGTSTDINPIHIYSSGQLYPVTLIAINGACSDTIIDSLLIPELNNILNDVPNIITPNGDGKNDCFTLSSLIDFTKCMNVLIYNRWGEKMFETSSANNCWNGKNTNGNDVPDGTYFYVLEVNGKKFQGTVAVMRN